MKQAISKEPTHFKAYFNRGFSYDKIGELDKAIEDYTHAIRLDTSSAYAYYNRYSTALSNDALNAFTRIIRLDASSAYAYYNRCSTTLSNDALNAFTRIIKQCISPLL